MERHSPSSVVIVNSITPDGRPLSVVRCPLSVVRHSLLHCRRQQHHSGWSSVDRCPLTVDRRSLLCCLLSPSHLSSLISQLSPFPGWSSVVRCPLSAQLYRCPLSVVCCLSSTPTHRALRSAASSTTAERAVGAFSATWC